jgi:hypothetical protein
MVNKKFIIIFSASEMFVSHQLMKLNLSSPCISTRIRYAIISFKFYLERSLNKKFQKNLPICKTYLLEREWACLRLIIWLCSIRQYLVRKMRSRQIIWTNYKETQKHSKERRPRQKWSKFCSGQPKVLYVSLLHSIIVMSKRTRKRKKIE